MPESFAASEDLGFVALSLPTGGSIWLAAASIYAVETHPAESFSMVKTVGESIGVVETPEVIFNSIQALQRNSEARDESRTLDKFVDFVRENSLEVEIVPDEALVLLESSKESKALRGVGYPVRGASPRTDPPIEIDPDPDFDLMSDESMERELRERGIDDHSIQSIIEARRDQRFTKSVDEELGEDLGDVMERMRRRDQEGDRG